MTDKQFIVMQEQFTKMQMQLNSVQQQINEVDNRLSNKIDTVEKGLSNKIEAGDRELFRQMCRDNSELKQLIKDNAEINGREHQMIIDTLERRYQDLDKRVKEVRGDIDIVDVVNKHEHEVYNKVLNINPMKA